MAEERTRRPASQYYWGDWWKDKALHMCSQPARGLWHEMNTLMHDGDPYGHLTHHGQPMTVQQLASLCRITPARCKQLWDELLSNGVPSIATSGALYSRRMVRDEKVREARAAGGKEGAEHGAKGAAHGAKGGRPRNAEGGEKTPLGGDDKPPPSSSSSSATSPPSEESPGGAALPPAPTPVPTPAPTPKPRAAKPPKEPKEPPPTNATWESYAAAYERRYHVNPVRNATQNGLLAQLVNRLGQDEAPKVAAFYLSLGGYPDHKLSLLLRDCEGIRTRWATGNKVVQEFTPTARAQRAGEFYKPVAKRGEEIIEVEAQHVAALGR